jgi:hypothetical protein
MSSTPAPYTITTTADGQPQEEVWQPKDTMDAVEGGFASWYGTVLCGIGPDDEPPLEFIALGHDAPVRALVAAANKWMRHYWSWTNLLDDTTYSALRALRRPANTHVVLLRATPAAGGEFEGTWQAVTVPEDTPGAVPVTVLDLRGPLDDPRRLRDQVEDLKHRLDSWGDRLRRPRVVCLCGSTRFWAELAEANLRETANGAVVLAPGCNLKQPHPLWADPVQAEALKARLDKLHWAKIRLADEIVVVSDATGYYGDSTRAEISYAHEHDKNVRYLRINLSQPHAG